MTRSHSPHAYPTIYFRMLEAFKKSPLPFHISCKDRAEAYNRRNEWLAFIKAIERQTKDPLLTELSKIGRGRKCSVTGLNDDILLWASRDLDDFNSNLEDQLKEFEDALEEDTKILTHPLNNYPAELTNSLLESSISSEDALDEFLLSPIKESFADKLFDEFLLETNETIIENEADSSINHLLNTPLKPIKTIITFSREEETLDGTENQIESKG